MIDMKRFFYIRCVVLSQFPSYCVYTVVTNCGVSRFCPMMGDKLPQLVVDFLLEHQEHSFSGGNLTVFLPEPLGGVY